jgi:hypothetical protein
MSSKRNGLLCLLVLGTLLTVAAWTPARASDRWAPITYTDPPATSDWSNFGPTSGEPDVGGTPSPRIKTSGYEISAPKRAGETLPWSQLPPWVRVVLRTWRVWFAGLS